MLGLRTVWDKYATSLRQFDAVLEHSKAVSSSLVGLSTPSANAIYGEQIFVTILTQCITLRRLMPDPKQKVPNELWDLPSMCAIARGIIEAHDAFLYIAGPSVPVVERDFRIYLWELHDKTRRLKMLESIASTHPDVASIRAECPQMTQRVESHPVFVSLRRDTQRKILDGDPPAFHLSQRERCTIDRVNFDYYNTVMMQLSQYVHTLPFALHQLFAFRAGSSEALSLLALPVEYIIPFMARITMEMRNLFPARTPAPPSRTARTMDIWGAVYSRGVRSAA